MIEGMPKRGKIKEKNCKQRNTENSSAKVNGKLIKKK